MARARPAQEDDSAPLFFLCAILICIVGPWGFSVVWALLFPGSKEVEQAFPTATEDGLRVRQSQTQAMASKREAQIAAYRSRSRLFTRGFIFRTSILAVLACWLLYIAVQIQSAQATSALYQNWDPWEILGVGRSAGDRDVKKAYRSLAMKLHPDKTTDAAAPAKFIQVKKAYDALTDPVAKRNFKLYGNPDGPVNVEMGLAIPSVSKENQGLVLILFVLLFIIGLPVTALCCMGGESETLGNGVLRDTMEALAESVKPSTDARALQDLLLSSGESAKVAAASQEEADALEVAAKEVLQGKGGKKGAAAEATAAAEVLLAAHLQRRTDILPDRLRAELESLLPRWRAMALAAAEMASKQGFQEATAAALEFCQCLVQALEPGSASASGAGSLLQVPHVTLERAKLWRKGPRKSAGLAAFLELSGEERKASLEGLDLTPQELADVEDFASTAPRVSVASAKVFVEGEDGVCHNDVATLEVRLKRANLREGEAAGSAHTPLFPKASVPEAWYLLIELPGRRSFSRVRLESPGAELVGQVKFKVPVMSKCRCTVHVVCEAYAGLDLEHKLSFEAKTPTAPPAYPEDEEEEGEGDDDDGDE